MKLVNGWAHGRDDLILLTKPHVSGLSRQNYNVMKQIDHLVKLMLGRPSQGGVSRKDFLAITGQTLALGVAGGLASSCKTSQNSMASSGTYASSSGNVPKLPPQSPPAKIPQKVDEPIKLEEWKAKTEVESGPL